MFPDMCNVNLRRQFFHDVAHSRTSSRMNLYVGSHLIHFDNNHKMSFFKSNGNIHKKEDGSFYVVSANKASSVTL